MNNNKKNVFFMEIFNEILKLNDNEIMIVYDTDGNIWFGLTDVIKALGYTDIFHAKDYINITKRNRIKYNKIRAWGQPQALNIQPNKIFINEAGLYELLSSSTKPLARIFMDKYVESVALHLG
jgi:prophage antirepressor-like protein